MRAMANFRRFGHILHVVVRQVLIHVMSRRLAILPKLVRKIFGPPLSAPDRFRQLLEEMGGTFIKFGQMLALQSDLLPLEYCRALFTLFDSVAPFSYEQVEQTFREDLRRTPKEIFDSFDVRPIAAGSIGQVHVAMLGRQKVAVKVRRPTILSDFSADIAAMKSIVRFVKLLRIRLLYWIIAPTEEFVAWTQEELDFRREAHYMEELGRNARDNPSEKVPAVFWSCTTARILTTEFLEGITVSEYLRNREEGQSRAGSGFDPNALAAHLVDNFLGDAFRHGMFHADLHPGNLMIMSGNVVGYVDFGISGVLSRYSRRHLISMTLAYARGDLDGMCESFFRITTRDKNANGQRFRERLQEVSSTWYGIHATHNRLRKSITSIMLDLLVLSRESGIWPQRDVIKYIRSSIALDGLLKTFSPGMDIGHHLELACERHLKWDSVRSLTSPDAVAGWFGGYTNLVRDGALRAVALLRRLGTEAQAAEQIFVNRSGTADKGERWFQALRILWVGTCMTLLPKPSRPVLAGHPLHWLASLAVVTISWILWRVLRRELAH
jgi:ubiquinone biosynthesis protein